MNFTHVFALFLLAIAPALAQADITRTILASKDNTIYQNNNALSAGGGAGIFAGANGMGQVRRGLLAFDLTSANIPASAIITNVQLKLYLGNAPNANNQTVSLHRLTADWGEGTAGSSTPAVSGSGGGFAAGTGDATWNSRFFSPTTPTLWTAAGGDFLPASASAVVNGPVETAFTWSSAGMIGDINAWRANPAANFGWALVNSSEGAGGSVKAFYSRSATQNAAGGALNPSFRPLLTVTFIPEPAAIALLVVALPFALMRRCRQL